uniref:Transposase n=1 Tax=Brugia timori TaxID=42155 RepID=A0A0R3R6P7_9BILA
LGISSLLNKVGDHCGSLREHWRTFILLDLATTS